MAAIDKIYGSPKQWDLLHDFLYEKKKSFLRNLYGRPLGDQSPLSNFTKEQDMWLLKNCPLDFVLEAIKEQYSDNELI